ncbi:MAG: acyl-CoA dehydrogenase family protein [Myxococcales bacterium]|nr:acyl-CoA dehydrogenase family protein [Myxococcales bacterium]
MISFGLEEDQQIIQETVRKFAAEELRPKMRAFEKSGVPDGLRNKFDETGLGLDEVALSTAVLVHEELAFGDPGAAVALSAPYDGNRALVALADDAQRARFAGKATAVCYSERKAPLDGFATVAKRVDGGWSLTGRKAFIVGAAAAELHLVFAQLEGASGWAGIAAFVVERGNAGLRVGDKHALLGLEAVAAHEIVLESCKVSDANRLLGGGELGKRVEQQLARAMVVNAARQVGLARAAYEFALEYTQERKAFGKPVAHFQSIAFTLADMATDVDAARWMVWRAATELDKVAGVASTVAATAHANEAAWRVADNGVQLLGGAGYVKDYPVEKWVRDTKALALFAPPSEVAELMLAGFVLDHHLSGDPNGLPSTAIQPFFT